MSGSDAEDALPLVPGRECGPCGVCCSALTIDEPELQKPQGVRCGNLRGEGGCAIYAARPGVCREFHCGWRRLKWVKESLRPDRSDVLIRLEWGAAEKGGGMQRGIGLGLLSEKALKADGLAETVAAAIAAELPVKLYVPGPPGFTTTSARINEYLVGPVKARNRKEVLAVLRRLRDSALRGAFRPVVMKHGGDPAGPAGGG